jgi:pimeloyl-ACP methyl ester carboxylesterase
MMRLHIESHGGESDPDSPPLLLIHGAGGSRLHWPPEIRRLPDVRVLAIDLPGHGESPGPDKHSIEAYAGWLLDWLESEGLDRVVPAGHSMGGAIALTMALQAPARLAGLVLVSSGARLRVAPPILDASAQPDTFLGAVDTITEWSFSPSAPSRLIELARKRMLEVDPTVLHDDFLACNAFDVMARLGSIGTPTLILCGTQDRLTPLKYSEFLAREIPNSTLQTIPEAGHMVMLEKPHAVASALQKFLAGISSPA